MDEKTNGVRSVKPAAGPPRQLLHCTHAGCGATFTRQWKLKEHETVHTGARPCRCTTAGCGRSFSRKSHLSRHMLQHEGLKQFKCKFATCTKSFFDSNKLKRHARYCHGDKNKYFKCNQPNCSLTFKKRRLFKLHLKGHEVSATFKYVCSTTVCSQQGIVSCSLVKNQTAALSCELRSVQMSITVAQASTTISCQLCKKVFKKADALRKHKRIHASHKPVLVCPREDCQAYFSTTFNLQHHIRKVHLDLLKYKCAFPDCPRMFAMRESMNRHLLRHDPSATTLKKRQRPKKSWQKRLNGHHLPLVEENLNRLFALRMRISRRAKVETNLSGLFNERKIPHYVDPEVNLRNLFGIKQSRPLEEKSEVSTVKG
uniref:P43 5S RNA-binding protein n=1 Tax=Seriola lalandi dorsalis TaxID=1841481 RepID=A0A3B4YVK7_SERLL